MSDLPLRITTAEIEVDDAASLLDIFTYEDQSGRSWASASDDRGRLRITELYRLAWIVLTARHGETRPFLTWVDEAKPRVSVGIAAPDPTGETPTPPGEESPVSQPAPESTPDPS